MTWKEKWRVLRQMITTELVSASIHRWSFLIFMLQTIVTPLLGLFVWRTALAAGADLPRDEQFFTTYYLMAAIVSWLTSSWLIYYFASNIRTGYIVRYLVQPSSPFFRWIANNIGEKLVKGLFILPLVGIAALGFRDSFALPTDPARWLMFLAAVTASAVMVLAMDVLIGSLAFWIEDAMAVEQGRSLLVAVLGGQLVPLALMPGWLDDALVALPFRYFYSFPLEIITGDLHKQELLQGFLFQTAWLVIVLWTTWFVWKKGLRGYAAFGS